MKVLSDTQHEYLEKLLGKLLWVKYNTNISLSNYNPTITTIISILDAGGYRNEYSEWINSLSDIYKMASDIEDTRIERLQVEYLTKYLTEKIK